MAMHYDNQAAMYIANNFVFLERAKHVEVYCHFIRDMVMSKRIVTSYVTSGAQLGDFFTKIFFQKLFSAMYQAEHD